MSEQTNYVTLTEDNFEREVLESDVPVLVDFWAVWCPPCRAIAPAIEELARELAGTAKVAKLNVDEVPTVAARFGIRSIPTLLFYQNGQVVDQLVGAAPKAAIAERFQRLLVRA